MNGYVILLSLLFVPAISKGQSGTTSKATPIDCINTGLPIVAADSNRHRAVLDSIATLLVGHWKLTKVESGWSAPQKLSWFSELVVNPQGQCVVRVEGNWVSGFQLALSLERGWIYFTISQLKGAPFLIAPISSVGSTGRKRTNQGRLSICETTLSLSDNRADGQHHSYERLADPNPSIASLTPMACQDSLSQVDQVQRVKGRVLFRHDLQAYVIDYVLKDRLDTHSIGMVCNWPQAKEYIGKTVAFSGKYFRLPHQIDTDSKRETVYYLRITGFHPIE